MQETTALQKFIDERKKAEQLYELARQRSASIIKRARAVAAETEKSGYKKGCQEGYQEGMEKGKKEAEQRFAPLFLEKLDAIEEKLNEFERRKLEVFSSLEEELLELVLQVARKVIRDEVSVKPEIVLSTLQAALSSLNERNRITIRLNQEDIPLVSEKRGEVRAKLDQLQSYQLVADSSIRRGGVYIETETGDIDASLETQEKELERFLLRDGEKPYSSFQE